MVFQMSYVASTVAIKGSICVVLLRIVVHQHFRWPLYAIIILTFLAALTGEIFLLVQCKPVAATWDPKLGTCVNPNSLLVVSYYISATAILTDWTCAIMPIFILWRIQLSTWVKISVGFILALGGV
jgi:hypothetical protein